MPIFFSNTPVIQPTQYPSQPPTVGFQPLPAYPQPYPPNPTYPLTGQGAAPIPQTLSYPSVPPSYPPYPSNPPIGDANGPPPPGYNTLSYEDQKI